MKPASRLLVLAFVAAACGAKRPPAHPAVAPPVAAPTPARPALDEKRLRETWTQPCLFTDKPKNPYCRIVALAVAPDGTVFAGGGSYASVELGGVRHRKRAYPFLLLAAFDADGRPRWSKSFGTQWRNEVVDLRVIGDTLIVLGVHGNGFALDEARLPDLSVRKVPGDDLGFQAETGFVAALRLDGTVVWAKNLSSLVGSDAAGHRGSAIIPDGNGGFRVAWREFAADDRPGDAHVAQLRLDGAVVEHRRIPGATFGEHRPELLIDRQGELYFAGPPDPRAHRLLRVERGGTVTEVARFARPPQEARPSTKLTVSWGLLPSGEILALLEYLEWKLRGELLTHGRQWLRLVRLDRGGRVLVDRVLLDPVAADGEWPLSLLGWDLEEAGGPGLVFAQRGRIVVDGREVAPVMLPPRRGGPASSIVVLELAAGGAVTRSVLRPVVGACVEHFPDEISLPRFHRDVLFACLPEQSVVSCDGKARGAAVIRLDRVPAP